MRGTRLGPCRYHPVVRPGTVCALGPAARGRSRRVGRSSLVTRTVSGGGRGPLRVGGRWGGGAGRSGVGGPPGEGARPGVSNRSSGALQGRGAVTDLEVPRIVRMCVRTVFT